MLSLLTAPDEIAQAQKALDALMQSEFPDVERREIKFRPMVLRDQKVLTSDRYWYRAGLQDGPNASSPRFLNWFGVLSENQLRISVEVNVLRDPTEGRSQGFFARDNTTGAVYLMHSGDVGGGTVGVRGPAFRAWHGEPRSEVFDGEGSVRFGFIVVPLRALDPTRSARRYVDTIGRFRNAVKTKQVDLNSNAFQRRIREFEEFYGEPRGRRTGNHPGRIDYLSRHGEVVDALHDWRVARPMRRGLQIVKNVFIDMGVMDASGDLIELYEVKTSAARTDVYSAIGQLMVHGPTNCRKFVVLPEAQPLADDLVGAFERQRITVLRFKLRQHGATIL